MPKAKSAKPEQFVDLSLLQQLEKEGFFAEMAKRYPSGTDCRRPQTKTEMSGHESERSAERFPDFELPDQDGQPVKLSELVGKFPFILSFYRGYW